ncbi:MAG: DUF1631 family protein [Pseudomonadales bacterium]|nr:DUF1631 family protein [Pseudomonadales bacterium]
MFNPSMDEWKRLFAAMQEPLAQCSLYAYPQLNQLFDNLLQNSTNYLLEAARLENQDRNKEHLIEAMQTCQSNAEIMAHQFQQALCLSFLNLENSASIPQTPDKQKSMGEQIICTKLIADTTRHYQQDLDTIEIQLPRLHNTYNAFGPENLIHCFYKAIENLAIDTLAIQQLLNLFQQEVLNQLSHFYQHLNPILNQASATTQRHESDAETPLKDNRAFQLDMVAAEPTDIKPNIYALDAIAKKQNPDIAYAFDSLPTINNAKSPAIFPEDTLSREDLLVLLNRLQKAYEPDSDGDLLSFINLQIQHEHHCDQNVALSSEDKNLINLSNLIFDQISASLPLPSAGLLHRLKMPYARLALENELFFTNKHHAARKLLDTMLDYYKSTKNEAIFLQQLQFTVAKIIFRFENDTAIFDDLLIHWAQLNHPTTKKDKLEQSKKQGLATADIEKLLFEHCKVLPLMLPFHTLVQQLWHKILQDIVKQQGMNSSHWQSAILLLDKTIQFSGFYQPQTLKKQVAELPRIHAMIKKLFNVYKISEMKQEIFFAQFSAIQDLILQGQALKTINSKTLPQEAFLQALIHSDKHLATI